MTVWTFLALAVGLAMLTGGAEVLVKSSATIASRLGIPSVIIGLTVVAFGTSAPEFAVSIGATVSGDTDVALGNVVGSSIANILLILGLSAVIGGLAVSQRIVRVDIPLLIAVSVVVFAMSLDHRIGRIDGILLVAAVIVYTVWLIRAARSERPAVREEYDTAIDELESTVARLSMPLQVVLVIIGVTVLVVGSQLLVGAATDIATEFGVSDLVIGLTVVAVGTSLPELATSVLATIRGERDIAVGNVVGSNLFNLMFVLGASGIVSSTGITVSDVSLRLDFPVMLAATFVLLPIVWNGFMIRRWEGTILVAFYIAYVTYLVLDANDSSAADVVGPAVLIVAPLVLMTFAVTGVQGWRRHRRGDQTIDVRSARDRPTSRGG